MAYDHKEKACSKSLERLYAAAELIWRSMNVECTVIGADSRILFELPPHHLRDCFCKRIERITGTSTSIEHFYSRCENLAQEAPYTVYECPFSLTNILIPVYEDDILEGALQVGPILTSDPEEILREHGISGASRSASGLLEIKKYLDSLHKGDISTCLAEANLFNEMVNSSHIKLECTDKETNELLACLRQTTPLTSRKRP